MEARLVAGVSGKTNRGERRQQGRLGARRASRLKIERECSVARMLGQEKRSQFATKTTGFRTLWLRQTLLFCQGIIRHLRHSDSLDRLSSGSSISRPALKPKWLISVCDSWEAYIIGIRECTELRRTLHSISILQQFKCESAVSSPQGEACSSHKPRTSV